MDSEVLEVGAMYAVLFIYYLMQNFAQLATLHLPVKWHLGAGLKRNIPD